MAGSVTINNTFANQAGPIPLSQLDSNFTQLATAVNTTQTYTNFAVDTGTANAYVLTFSFPTVVAYSQGLEIVFLASNTNTGASTVNINGLGPVSILTTTFADLGAGAITAGSIVTIVYDGLEFQLLSGNNTSTTTIPGQAGYANQVLRTNGSVLAWGDAWGPYVYVNTSQTVTTRTTYHIDSSSGTTFTLTLPASPSANDWVQFVDVGQSCGAYPIVLGANGSKIMNNAANMSININCAAFYLVYNTTFGWVVT
jgi:hypothetical protein